MSETKKFLDFGGLQVLWDKMKNTFASKVYIETLDIRLGTAEQNIINLETEIDGVEAITLSYAPKTVEKYSNALALVNSVSAGQIFVVGNEEKIDDITYKEGFYIVDNNKSLHYVGTTVGGSDSEIVAIRERLSTLEGQIISAGNIQTADGTTLSGITIADNSLIMIYDDAVVADSESVNALTHRAIAAKFSEVERTISVIPKFKIEVVETLPEIKNLSTIYLLKNSSEHSNNIYTEYIYIEGKGWEKLGEQSIVLDDYVTKDFLRSEINNALGVLAEYAKTTEVEAKISATKDQILGVIEGSYASKSDVAGLMTETDIITSIQEGNIGEVITITTDQINGLS